VKRPATGEEYVALRDAYLTMMDLAESITHVLNGMSNDTREGHLAFCVAMENEHRTLQQAFTRLCTAWFMHASDPEYRTDLRNEGTHALAVALKTVIEDAYLPFI
jgi:hypothetical protein